MDMTPDFIELWFRSLCGSLRTSTSEGWLSERRTGQLVLEVFSDSSNELFACGLLATHLRRFGREFFQTPGRQFWVRSEWAKFDLCYGLAHESFRDWNHAWNDGITGDLGTIEVKVVYSTYGTDKIVGTMVTLAQQLATRIRQVFDWRKEAPNTAVPCAESSYHGLVFYVAESDHNPADVAALQCRGLNRLAAWERVATLSSDERRALWPRSDIDSPQHLWLGLHCAPQKGAG